MTNNELLTIAISTSALLFSGLSLYLQFFRKKSKVLLRLLHIEYPKLNILLCYSLINSGNQDILLKEISFLGGQTNKGKGEGSYRSYKCECSDSRSVIKPGEIKLINVKIKSEDFTNSKAKEKSFISFEMISPKGNYQEFFHEITFLNCNNRLEKAMWKLRRINKFKD